MKLTLKNTLMTLTVLSTGFFLLSSEAAQAGFKLAKGKPKSAANLDFKQYPELGKAKDDVTLALSMHNSGSSFPAKQEQLRKYQEEVDKYNEIVRRLNQNKQCNIALLNANFSNGNAMWKKIAAYAEDSSAALLAQASGSLGSSDADKARLNEAQNMTVSEDSDAPSGGDTSSSPYSNMDENTTDSERDAIIKSGQKNAQDKADADSNSGMDLGEGAAYGKVRWDVGYAILKDIYAHPRKWGNLTRPFTPWVDQQYAYDQYLKDFYKEKEKAAKEAARQKERERQAAIANEVGYLGNEGDKVTFTINSVRVLFVNDPYAYGARTTVTYQIIDDEGHVIIWTTDKDLKPDMTITATVKKQKEYRGEKQTVVTRGKIQPQKIEPYQGPSFSDLDI